MKSNKIWIFFLLFAMYACQEDPVGQQPTDQTAPGAVTNVEVTNTPGGARLTYTLPGDEDLLYVKAVYERNGQVCENRTSLYRETLVVEGFGDMEPHEVKIIAVDRSRNESAPVKVTINPLEPTVLSVGRSLDVIPDFGGLAVSWQNDARANISITIMEESEMLMEYVHIETFYSAMATGKGTVRGLDTITRKFGAYVQDHWGNRSETKFYELEPYYETEFDKTLFRAAWLPNDANHGHVGFGRWDYLESLWDGRWGDNGDNSGFSSDGNNVMPQSFTMDLGVVGRLSRIRIHQRAGGWQFAEGNPHFFELWGCQTLDGSGNWSSWTKLADLESIKPSGLPLGQTSNEDLDRAINGEDFFLPAGNPKVRYLRMNILRTWGLGNNINFCELKVYGDNR